MKAMYSVALVVATAALLGSSAALRASESDDRIESSFKNSAVYQTFLKDEHIEISSTDGAVTLSGNVHDETHKPMAQDTAEALPGVKSVDNRIVVLQNSNSHTTDVSLNNGIRRLPFQASMFQAQKEQTTEYAKDVEGVKEVNTEMSVAKASEKPAETVGNSINDASITAQAKKSLSSDRLTRALDTKVTTINGIVSIGGKASNGTQKDLVTKLVTGVNGVKSVVNHMIIEETLSKND
jgi:hyperosmotically inducible periplasmic protein